MASYTVSSAKHATLVADTVDTVTLGGDYGSVEVVNRSGAGEIYFLVDGAGDPTVGGDDNHCIPAVIGAMGAQSTATQSTTVRLISSAATAYTVRGS